MIWKKLQILDINEISQGVGELSGRGLNVNSSGYIVIEEKKLQKALGVILTV